jgi:hypothetical protein
VWERETTVVKSVLSHHLYDGAVTVEGVGQGDYYGQVCFKAVTVGVGQGDYCRQVCFKSPPL